MDISWRQLRSTVLFLFLGTFAFCGAASATPPTHYNAYSPGTSYVFMGHTPDDAVQAAVIYRNTEPGRISYFWENLRMCSVYIASPGDVHYRCPVEDCWTYYLTGAKVCANNIVVVRPGCGAQYGASWNGTEFYCPPEPDCDGPAQ